MEESRKPPLQNAPCEIIPCVNGFLVMSPQDFRMGTSPYFQRDVHVFESFEALMIWLAVRFPWRNTKVKKDG